jgi:5-methylcytosine-specific restriction endonuclease McrA
MRPKPLSKDDILRAMRHTRSNRAAANYLGVSYQHYKPYAKMFTSETGQSLFDVHLNQCGKGIPKHLKGRKKEPALQLILSGHLNPASFSPEKIKNRLIHENLIAEDCHRCGFHERRVIDYRIPLLLNFKDNNRKNYRLENLELLCYNCYFLFIGDVFTPDQIDLIESSNKDKFKIEKPEWDLDDEQLDNMRKLGIL